MTMMQQTPEASHDWSEAHDICWPTTRGGVAIDVPLDHQVPLLCGLARWRRSANIARMIRHRRKLLDRFSRRERPIDAPMRFDRKAPRNPACTTASGAGRGRHPRTRLLEITLEKAIESAVEERREADRGPAAWESRTT